MIKYTSNKQISIEEFILPFSGNLDKENRWVKLANNIYGTRENRSYMKAREIQFSGVTPGRSKSRVNEGNKKT